MKAVGPRARDHRDLRTGRAPEFGCVGRSLNAEFLERIDRHQAVGAAERAHRNARSRSRLLQIISRRNADVCGDAINREVVRTGTLAVEAELSGLPALSHGYRRAWSKP